eukprot:GEMP01082831.1.p2 GENE.GEMP01082831.1~~GEMP01082831.1.p2  ORF type:complete len:102 (+),score=19.04 GEMP01082831.1:104-409(+)
MAVADPSPETSKPTSRFAELYSYAKERFFPLGESFFVCYLLIDLAMYSALFVVARLAFVQSTGREFPQSSQRTKKQQICLLFLSLLGAANEPGISRFVCCS